jgi:hypothetical protein
VSDQTNRQAPLGVNQIEVLKALKKHGDWPGGWVWDNPSLTRKILNSLVRRGLVEVTSVRSLRTGDLYDVYTPKADAEAGV